MAETGDFYHSIVIFKNVSNIRVDFSGYTLGVLSCTTWPMTWFLNTQGNSGLHGTLDVFLLRLGSGPAARWEIENIVGI